MKRLRLTDLHAATRFLRDLYELDGLPSFQKRLLARLPTVVPCDMVIYCENNLRTKESRGFSNLPGAFDEKDARIYGRHVHESPLLRAYRRGRGSAVWDAVERAVAWAGKEFVGVLPPSAPLTVVDRAKDRGIIRTEENANLFGATRAYVGVFVSPPRPGADVYTVEVSKILRARYEVIEGRNWEADLLRQIQANLGPTR